MIFFDIDGTLLDHEKAEREGAKAFQKLHAGDFSESEADFHARWHRIAEKHMDRFINGETTNQGQRRDRMRELFSKPNMKEDEAGEIFAYYLEQYEKYWCLFPDVVECLEQLRSFPLGVITNGGGVQQRKKISRMGLDPHFSVIVVSGEERASKPDPAIFVIAAQKAGAKPEECAYVGDRLQADAEAARNAGFRGIWLNRKHLSLSHAGIHMINGLTELPGMVVDSL